MTDPISSVPIGCAPQRQELCELNHTTLRLWEWGPETGPVIICAHGGFDHGRMFDSWGTALGQLGYRVVAPDLRGHGDSGRVPHGHAFGPTVADLGALIHRYGDSAGLIGHSMGASMVLEAAATWPEMTRWVISFDGLGPPPEAFGEFDLAVEAANGFDRLTRALGRGSRVFPTRQQIRSQRGDMNTRLPDVWLNHLVDHGTVEADGGWSWKWDPLVNTGLPDGFRVEWITDNFGNVTCPVLVLTGAEDDLWSTMTNAEIDVRMAHFSDGRHVAVAEAGHYLHLEAPLHAFPLVTEFLDEVEPR